MFYMEQLWKSSFIIRLCVLDCTIVLCFFFLLFSITSFCYSFKKLITFFSEIIYSPDKKQTTKAKATLYNGCYYYAQHLRFAK